MTQRKSLTWTEKLSV